MTEIVHRCPPVGLAHTHGTETCVHCQLMCNSYCRSCRRAVDGDCFPQHELDHSQWRERRYGWTPTRAFQR